MFLDADSSLKRHIFPTFHYQATNILTYFDSPLCFTDCMLDFVNSWFLNLSEISIYKWALIKTRSVVVIAVLLYLVWLRPSG